MAHPKITKLSDPSNPYGGKKTPTRERTAAEKMDAVSRSRSAPSRAAKPAPKAKKEPSGILGRAWRDKTDARIKKGGG